MLIDRDLVPFPQRSRHDLVGIDNRRAAYVAHTHPHRGRVQEAGVRGQAPFGAEVHRSARLASAEAVRTTGLEYRPEFVCQSARPEEREEYPHPHRRRPPGLGSCANDYTAAQLMRTLAELSIGCPDEVHLAGFDDVKYDEPAARGLTTIHQPCAEIRAAAVRTMIDRLRMPGSPTRDVLLDFRLVVRRSSEVVRREAAYANA